MERFHNIRMEQQNEEGQQNGNRFQNNNGQQQNGNRYQNGNGQREPTTSDTVHPQLTTPSGLPKQYVKGNTAIQSDTSNHVTFDDTKNQTHTTTDDEVSDSSTVQSNDIRMSTEQLNQLAQFRTAFAALTQFQPDNRNIHMGMTNHYDDMDVHCKSEILEVRGFAMYRDGFFFSTTDGGAHTMILGNGWHFHMFYKHRSVNIVGFHEQHAR